MSILQEDSASAPGSGDLEPTSSQEQSPLNIDIDLRTCPPDELSAWLLAHRFQDNAMDVASFLLNCTTTLPNAEEISAQLLGGGGNDDDDDDDDDDSEGEGEETEELAAAKADPQTEHLQNILNSTPQNDTNNNEIEVSCINPRGKFLLSIFEEGIVLTNPKKRTEEQIPISRANLKREVIWFRKPEDYKKVKQLQLSKDAGEGGSGKKGKDVRVPGHMVLLCLEDNDDDSNADGDGGVTTMFRNKQLKQVCFQLPSYPQSSSPDENGSTNNNDGNNNGNGQLTEENWYNGLSSALFSSTKNGIIRVHATIDKPSYSLKCKGSGYMFQSEGEPGSATTTEGMPYVGCYQGFNDGALFPLKEGLLFFKPPLFVPRSKLASISCGRGSGGSRYVDMMVQLEVESNPTDEQEGAKKKKKKQSDTTLEFTNIHRDELTGLNDYIHKILIPAMQRDADADGAGEHSNNDDTDDDDDDDDSEEVMAEVVNSSEDDENESSDGRSDEQEDEGSSPKRRPSRAAKSLARETTRAAMKAIPARDCEDDDGDDSDEFEEEEDSDDESVVSDGESGDSSSEDEAGVEEVDSMDDDSDGSDYGERKSKKARIE